MINIEKNVETALYKSAYQGLKIEFEPLRGKPFHITSLDLVEGSFKIIMASTSTNNMQIGNMSANDLCMELMNPTDSWGFGKFDDVYFCGATMRLKLLVYDQTQDIMTETPLRFRELFVTSTSIGHTFLHLPQETHLLLSHVIRSSEK